MNRTKKLQLGNKRTNFEEDFLVFVSVISSVIIVVVVVEVELLLVD